MAEASVTIPGSKGGPAIRPGLSLPAAVLLRLDGRTILVDAGLGAAAGLCRAGVALTDLDAILVSHLHSDHYLELGPLVHTAWTAGLKRPVPVFGLAGLEACWRRFCAAMADDIVLRIADEGRPELSPLAEFHSLEEGRGLDPGGVEVGVMRNCRPPVVESHALRFADGGKTVVLSGDTAPMEEMVDFARGADLLVHEAMPEAGASAIVARMGYRDDRLLRHIRHSHSPAEAVARIATRAGVRALALYHLIPGGEPGFEADIWRAAVAPHYDGPLHVGHDELEIAL